MLEDYRKLNLPMFLKFKVHRQDYDSDLNMTIHPEGGEGTSERGREVLLSNVILRETGGLRST